MRISEFYFHITSYEPIGLVLLEAMATGLPVISLDGMGNRDIIIHNQNGFVFSEQDLKVFGDTLINHKNDKEKYLNIVAAGQKSASAYNIKIMFSIL